MTDTELRRLNAICVAANVDDIEDVSDGFHTFNDLYEQRMILFAALVNAYRDKAWKSLRHEDGEPCFGGDWFIVGIDTPKGSYSYHYGIKYWDVFDCRILPRAKHWDGHTEKDAMERLMSLSDERVDGEWRYGKEDGKYGYRCSECGFFIPWYYDYYGLDNINFIRDYHRCPKCEAPMIRYTGMDEEV
jgi:hypothetical protein